VGGSAYIVTGGGADQVAVAGTVNGSLFVDTGAGNDQVNLGRTALVKHDATVLLGDGGDTFFLGGTVTGKLTARGGAGNDTLVLSGGTFGSIDLKGFEHIITVVLDPPVLPVLPVMHTA
jgi:hypothetical protein